MLFRFFYLNVELEEPCAEVALAAVAEDNDDVAGIHALGDSLGGPEGGAGADAGDDAFVGGDLAGEPVGLVLGRADGLGEE